MQAVILAGGEGTRLRPLTSDLPKPVVTLVDRPFIAYMLAWLRRHGVSEVVMSCGFLAEQVRAVMGTGEDWGLKLRYVDELEPLGTAGAVKLAERYLDDRFLVLNGDVLTDFDLSAQIEQHERTGARGTLALIPVPDPSAYGLVRLERNGAVREFLEKPTADQIDTNLINAGAYVLEKEVLALMEPDTNTSWEHDIFPRLIDDGLFGYEAAGYWLDIGTPERYLEGTFDIITGKVETGLTVSPVGENCSVSEQAALDQVVLRDGATVEAGAVVERSVVLEGALIGANVRLRECIICPRAVVGAGATVGEGTIIGTGVEIEPESVIGPGERIFTSVKISEGMK